MAEFGRVWLSIAHVFTSKYIVIAGVIISLCKWHPVKCFSRIWDNNHECSRRVSFKVLPSTIFSVIFSTDTNEAIWHGTGTSETGMISSMIVKLAFSSALSTSLSTLTGTPTNLFRTSTLPWNSLFLLDLHCQALAVRAWFLWFRNRNNNFSL